jgi:predicted GTPase
MLAEKPEIIVLNKMDLILEEKDREKKIKDLRKKLKLGAKDEVLAISGAARFGVRDLLDHLWDLLHPRGAEVDGWKKPVPSEP